MPRKKIPDELKRKNMNVTIDCDLFKLLNKYMEENKIYNKSKYVENLIIQDLKNKKY